MSDGAKSEQTDLVTRVEQAELHEQQLAVERQFLHAILVGTGVGGAAGASAGVGALERAEHASLPKL